MEYTTRSNQDHSFSRDPDRRMRNPAQRLRMLRGVDAAVVQRKENEQGQTIGPLPYISSPHPSNIFVVPGGWGLTKIASHLQVDIEALIEANRDKIKTWGDVQGFNAGEVINIPKGEPTERKNPQQN